MAKSPGIYQKLTRPRAGLASYSSLWLAPDHVMLARSTGFTEQYHRFQLSDIQAFLITPSNRRQNWTIAWVVAALLALVPLIVVIVQRETPVVSGILLLLSLIVLLINVLLGPTCNVSVVTRVHTARLPLARRRTADKVLARLEPLIAAAQADLLIGSEPVSTTPPPFA